MSCAKLTYLNLTNLAYPNLISLTYLNITNLTYLTLTKLTCFNLTNLNFNYLKLSKITYLNFTKGIMTICIVRTVVTILSLMKMIDLQWHRTLASKVFLKRHLSCPHGPLKMSVHGFYCASRRPPKWGIGGIVNQCTCCPLVKASTSSLNSLYVNNVRNSISPRVPKKVLELSL